MSAAVPTAAAAPTRSLRHFAPEGVDVWTTCRWEQRDAAIRGADGGAVFEQKGVWVPADWSPTATNIVVSRYFAGQPGTSEREDSIQQLISRVCDSIARWGLQDGYFDDTAEAEAFRDDLRWLCLHQHAAFNSPVWFNLGLQERPQVSACFINGVQDEMASILELARTEGTLFKHGSGSGANLSRLRADGEPLSGGGTASGPLAFMKGLDAMAGAIKSGGRTRRAARMVMLDDHHPDLLAFVRCKADEERKAWALIEAGYDGGFDVGGGAYDSVAFQNANHSVRLSDAFLEAVEEGRDWSLLAVRDGSEIAHHPAGEILDEIAQAAWLCGDPGVQFSDTVNRWHSCAADGPIRASNPCGEFVFLDDSACNLASLNLLRFVDEQGFQVERFEHAVSRLIVAMDILVDRAGYPQPRATELAHRYRPLGLGFSNLGGLLLQQGLAYDSDAGRELAAGITALMGGVATRTSAELAERLGPFERYEANREHLGRVLSQHHAALSELAPGPLRSAAERAWTGLPRRPVRNAQTTLLAPTGTISFMMDCDTTGIEPELALVKQRLLVAGGTLKVVNQRVDDALRALGYAADARAVILAWVEDKGTAAGAPGLAAEHLPVFDTAFGSPGRAPIDPMGHLKMMAAVQPFLSGAISKTVNLPHEATAERIKELIVEAWKLGLKSVTVYRDGSKRTQPVGSAHSHSHPSPTPQAEEIGPVRRHLPATRQALTHKFSIGGHEGYLTVGLFADGSPGELFLVMAKEGSVVSGLVNVFATSVSLALQYGVPLEVLCSKFAHTRFEPSGYTGDRDVPFASSITDYVFRWLEARFQGEHDPQLELELGVQSDAPPCPDCGALMVRSGACYKCGNCGGTSGCS